ncbi:sensor histidine kinase [Paenibacillus sacheonensis]|uniref:histidine kinase n=1 Tax=Paenibacillus sacheonensis TaxID=742054 RepID=A0A7X4YJP7_9BACL|nr:sensor histidine kinase [Paenibacillus sacheonensis]MBM7564023.1 two-component system sensor histidine kinase YesM [Paenibacillus sacheonensis]NBC67642.1 hypothetical protein [Paenibacillus sacheonensis]
MKHRLHAFTGRPFLYSLKNRVTVVFLFSTFMTFAIVGSASYYTISSILYNKIERNIQLTMDEVSRDTDLAVDNLLSVSSQLSYGGTVSNDLTNYLSTDSYSSKKTHYDNINAYLNLIDFTNPNAGFHFYYYPDTGKTLFENGKLNRPPVMTGLPVLTDKTLFTFYGPHPSLADGKNGLVLSLTRPVDTMGGSNLYLYLESSLPALANIMKTKQLGMDIKYVIANEQNRIVYSQLPGSFQIGALYAGESGDTIRSAADAYVFDTTSRYGWHLVAAFNKSAFTSEIRAWALRMALIGAVLMLLSLLLGYLVWRSVYVPIRLFKKEIGHMASNQFDTVTERTNVAEFDQVLKQFHSMKDRIQSLLLEVRQQENEKRQLEVDKLLSQINPHFLYNSLNTVQWIARTEGQRKIVKLVAELTRLLRYNLGKEGSIVTIEQELTALKDYVALQLVRNDDQFKAAFDVDDAVLQVEIPRFILQPLVENAICHGLKEGSGTIEVTVRRSQPGFVTISVRDDGTGMSEEKLARLFEGNGTEVGQGLGIGLNYVNRMLDVHFGEGCRLQAESSEKDGTVYWFTIPTRRKEAEPHV